MSELVLIWQRKGSDGRLACLVVPLDLLAVRIALWVAHSRPKDKSPSPNVDPIVHAEFSGGFQTQNSVDNAQQHFDVRLSTCNQVALFAALRTFKTYKARGGTELNVLPDFFAGTNA